MADEWFVRVQGKDYGPVDLDTLREWKREGRLIADNELREAEGKNWVKAETLFATLTEVPVSSAPLRHIFAHTRCAESSAKPFRIYRKGWLTFFVLALIVAISSTVAQICLFLFFTSPQPEPAPPVAPRLPQLSLPLFCSRSGRSLSAGIQIASADAAGGQPIRLHNVSAGVLTFGRKSPS